MQTQTFSQGYIPCPQPVVSKGQYLKEIREASMGHLVIVFTGTGSAFAKKNDQSGIIVAKNGNVGLVDCGANAPQALHRHGISVTDFDFYHLTHSHADHVGGYEEVLLMHKFVLKKKPKLLICRPYAKTLWEDTLKGGCEINEAGALRLNDLVEPIFAKWKTETPREIYTANVGSGEQMINFDIFRTAHTPGDVDHWEAAFWSTGLVIDGKVLYSGDTRFDPQLFNDVHADNLETILHDCQLFSPGTVHACYDDMKTLPDDIKKKTLLYHYGDNYEAFEPKADGFAGFARPFQIYRWKL